MNDPVRAALAERLADWGSDTYELQPGEIPAAKADMRAAAAVLAAMAQPAEPVAMTDAGPTAAPGQCPTCGEYSMSARAMQGLYGERVMLDGSMPPDSAPPAPQPRGPLTDEQIRDAMLEAGVRIFQPGLWDVLISAGRAIERAHGIGAARAGGGSTQASAEGPKATDP